MLLNRDSLNGIHGGVRSSGRSVQECPQLRDATDLDVTLVTQCSLNRAWEISKICDVWAGKVIVALYVGGTPLQLAASALNMSYDGTTRIGSLHCASVHLLGGSDAPRLYPINRLRNLAIEHVKTSHFFYADIDFWPDASLYRRIKDLTIHSPLLFRSQNNAIAVPAMEVLNGDGKRINKCKTVSQCRQKYESSVPGSFTELKQCIRSKKCDVFDSGNSEAHSTTDLALWFKNADADVRHIPCFKSLRYEPYLVLPACPSTPAFNEAFVGYGKNKVEHISHLRLAGFEFYVLPEGFVLHFPHPETATHKIWSTDPFWWWPARRSDLRARNNRLYADSLEELAQRYSGRQHTPMCASATDEESRRWGIFRLPGPKSKHKLLRSVT